MTLRDEFAALSPKEQESLQDGFELYLREQFDIMMGDAAYDIMDGFFEIKEVCVLWYEYVEMMWRDYRHEATDSEHWDEYLSSVLKVSQS